MTAISSYLNQSPRSYEDMIVQRAERQAATSTRALIGRTYINHYEREHGQIESRPFVGMPGTASAQALDEAAIEAIEDSDYAYTVLIQINQDDKRVRLLDLTDHGRAVLDEREEQEQAEAKHRHAESLGVGRKVL